MENDIRGYLRTLPPHVASRQAARLLSDAADEIERLQAIIDKLPKTADGVPVVPGMTVYYRGMGGVVQTTNEMCVNAIKAANGFILNPSGCYSTQVAADAAGGE